MQREINVSCLLFFILFNVFAQQDLTGTFCKTEAIPGFGTCIDFSPEGLFNYVRGGEINSIGEGTFIIQNNNLILNYKSLPPNKLSFHRLAIWENFSDSIKVQVRVFDLDKNPLKGINVIYAASEHAKPEGIILNQNGEGSLKFTAEQKEVEMRFSYVGYQSHMVSLTSNYNYLVEVFLSKDTNEIRIDAKKEVYTIVISEENSLLLRNIKGEIFEWKKKNRSISRQN